MIAQPAPPAILVVEDEVLIRVLISELMRDAGYTVIEAADADEALMIIGSGIQLDLIFSDIRMPGSIDGLGLLQSVKLTHPDLPVIMTSAHCKPSIALDGGAARFVAKPYDMDEVVGLIRNELRASERQLC